MIVSQEPKKWFTSHYQLKISMSGLLYYYSAIGAHNHDGNIEATISHCGQFKSTCQQGPFTFHTHVCAFKCRYDACALFSTQPCVAGLSYEFIAGLGGIW